MCVTTLFALVPERAHLMLDRVLKIQLFTFVGLLVLCKRVHVIGLIWVLVLSIGYYGIKGGLFTFLAGGISVCGVRPTASSWTTMRLQWR